MANGREEPALQPIGFLCQAPPLLCDPTRLLGLPVQVGALERARNFLAENLVLLLHVRIRLEDHEAELIVAIKKWFHDQIAAAIGRQAYGSQLARRECAPPGLQG